MVISKEGINIIQENKKQTEIFKIISAYFIKGVTNSITDRINEGDTVNYSGTISSQIPIDIQTAINSIFNNQEVFESNGIPMAIENATVHCIRINKNGEKYDSHLKKMSMKSFREMVVESIRIMNSNYPKDGSISTDTNHLLDKCLSIFDEESEEGKYLNAYKEIAFDNENAKVVAILLTYNRKIINETSTERIWYFYDSENNEDNRLHQEYLLNKEFEF